MTLNPKGLGEILDSTRHSAERTSSMGKFLQNFLFSHYSIFLKYFTYSTPHLTCPVWLHNLPLYNTQCHYLYQYPTSPYPLSSFLYPSNRAGQDKGIGKASYDDMLLVCLHKDSSAGENPFVARIQGLQGSQKYVRVPSEWRQVYRALINVHLPP